MLTQKGFYKKGEALLNSYNLQINQLEKDEEYIRLLKEKELVLLESEQIIEYQKQRIKQLKKERTLKREEAQLQLSAEAFQKFNIQLNEESKKESILLKKMNKHWKGVLESKDLELSVFQNF